MKENIIDTVNIARLERLIGKFEKFNGTPPDYLIMSHSTHDALKEAVFNGKLFYSNYSDLTYDEFQGIPIAFCSKLALGEVDAL